MHVLSKEKCYFVFVNVLYEIKSSKLEPLIECLSVLWTDLSTFIISFIFELKFVFVDLNGIYIKLSFN